MLKFTLLICFLGCMFCSCKSVTIVDKPIVFDQEREALSLEYMSKRYGLEKDKAIISPKMIVVHWTAIPSLEQSYNAFKDSRLPGSRADITSASSLNVSAQFLVDQDGSIYRLLPERTMARHVIGLNHCAIGIENVGGTADKPLTKKQLKSNIKLIKYLKKKYPDIDYLIGHYEYTLFEGHPLWLEIDEKYRTKKTDPGETFMEGLRAATTTSNWEEIPVKN
ncbi:peptidoglycan recognition protein family protein [Lutimonas sp.]|uniref:peptidoglycan recognition protein family protein n=1 Tax=Lutimonas sp. TaxID=1872403 RepID=UPI003D9B7C6E